MYVNTSVCACVYLHACEVYFVELLRRQLEFSNVFIILKRVEVEDSIARYLLHFESIFMLVENSVCGLTE